MTRKCEVVPTDLKRHFLVCSDVKQGNRFCRLLVLGRPFILRVWGNRRSHAVCRCDCGKILVVGVSLMRSGRMQSCGCLGDELRLQRNKSQALIPGESVYRTRLYSIWQGMQHRCHNPQSRGHCWYGARGITVCAEWQQSFQAFREWAYKNGYQDDLSIDRIDNDRGYSPANCRWATMTQQQNNRRNNVRLKAFGETKTVSEWSRDFRCRVSLRALMGRLRNQWPTTEAITTPPQRRPDRRQTCKLYQRQLW